MYDIRENIRHGIDQYTTEANEADKAGKTERAQRCRAVVGVLKETLESLDAHLAQGGTESSFTLSN